MDKLTGKMEAGEADQTRCTNEIIIDRPFFIYFRQCLVRDFRQRVFMEV